MAEALAGFVCGYALALAATPVVALALLRARPGSRYLQQVLPQGTSLIAVSVIIHTFAFLAFTAVGLLLGLVLAGMEDRAPAGGLGSPNRAFTAFVLALAAIAALPLAVVAPRWRGSLLAGGVVFALCFGWAIPYLALLGPEDG